MKRRCGPPTAWRALAAFTLAVAANGPVAGASAPLEGASTATAATAATAAGVEATLDRYCVACHSERVVEGRGAAPSMLVTQLREIGLAFDTLDLADLGGHTDVWERVVRKLESRSMPPVGRPRPDEETYEAVASWLETALDRHAAEAPNPGRRPALHRLSRTEYRNAVRDLLALDDLPKEFDVSTLLPADNATSGFDNLAELLFVSPATLERYLAAARRISRLALGDTTLPPIVDRYQLDRDLIQDGHLDGLPLGTRGGALIRSHLPADGEYIVTVEFAQAARAEHEVEVSVDGERVGLFTIGGRPLVRGASGVFAFEAEPPVDVRVPLDAGPREIAVAFLRRTGAQHEGLVRASRRGPRRGPAIATVSVSGPYGVDGSGDTPSRRRILTCTPDAGADATPCAREILSTLARRAYRRPVTEDDLGVLLPFYEGGAAQGGFERGIQHALERMLVSPEFLFRIERDPEDAAPGAPYRIGDLELASRLSFFLWSSVPDDELLDRAVAGQLRDPAVLEAEVRRMLADERSRALVDNFAEQWLYLRDVEAKEPDPGFFPGFDENLRQAFVRETALFIDSVLRADRSVSELLTADYTFLNERLAKHYGIPHVYGSHFRRVSLAGTERRGLLGQGGILTLTSYATRTSPVLRGKWILENLLASPPPPPPPDIPALAETTDDGAALSMRAAMERHRANPACASCHAQMDPLGFALENFDAVGRWRARGESDEPIDASGVLPDGTSFEGPTGMRHALLRDPERFVATVAEKLLTYALGRNLESYDMPAVRAIVRGAAADEHRFSSLVLGIVQSTPFQMRMPRS
ncbi:MAG: DUF1592 domain-containing protein [Acidobacteria bacterium]|nr:DUF1592 domain-containing protein [Acidobacteriota bacterium]